MPNLSRVSADIMIEKSFGMDEPIDIDQFNKKKQGRKNKVKMDDLEISEDYIILDSEAHKSIT